MTRVVVVVVLICAAGSGFTGLAARKAASNANLSNQKQRGA